MKMNSGVIIKAIEEIFKETEKNEMMLSYYDIQLNNLLHKIEESNFSASEGYKIAKNLQVLRSKRRVVKWRISELSKEVAIIRGLKGNAKEMKGTLKARVASNKNKKADYDEECLALTRKGSLENLIESVNKDYDNLIISNRG